MHVDLKAIWLGLLESEFVLLSLELQAQSSYPSALHFSNIPRRSRGDTVSERALEKEKNIYSIGCEIEQFDKQIGDFLNSEI